MLYRRSKALRAYVFLFNVVMPSFNKISYLIFILVLNTGLYEKILSPNQTPISQYLICPYNRLWPKRPWAETTHPENWPKRPTYQGRNDPLQKLAETTQAETTRPKRPRAETTRICTLIVGLLALKLPLEKSHNSVFSGLRFILNFNVHVSSLWTEPSQSSGPKCPILRNIDRIVRAENVLGRDAPNPETNCSFIYSKL